MKANDSLAAKFQEDTRIPYVLYQLAKSYYMAAEYTKACAYFDCGLYFDLNPRLEYVIDMVETYGYALRIRDNRSETLHLDFCDINESHQEVKICSISKFLINIFQKQCMIRLSRIQ